MENYNGEEHVNIGTGEEVTIKEMAEMIKKIVKFEGQLRFNEDKPDGTPRKLLDVSKLEKLGWKHKVGLKEGITRAYQWFIENCNDSICINFG